jgi:hypothetical protein
MLAAGGLVRGYQHRSAYILYQKHQEFGRLGSARVSTNGVYLTPLKSIYPRLEYSTHSSDCR